MNINLNDKSIEGKFDNIVDTLNRDLIEPLGLKGKQDASKTQEISEPYFNTSVLEYAQGKTQEAIDTINQFTDSITTKDSLTDAENNAAKQVNKNLVIIHDKQQQKLPLQKRKNEIVLDAFKTKYYLFFVCAAALLGVIDGFTSFNSFVYYFPYLVALAVAFGITIIISVSHFAYCRWILSAKTKFAKHVREAIVLIVAFIVFYAIANLRVQAMANVINLSIADTGIQQSSVPQLSPITIATISFVMFLIVYGVSFKFSKSKEEYQLEDEDKKISKKLQILDEEIKQLVQENEQMESQVQQQSSYHKHITKYAGKAKQRAKNTGENAIKAYKHNYANGRGNVPAFFATTGERTYTDNIIFLN